MKSRISFKGFTLIELLVVIAIIAILAAILFPVFAQAREKARQSACISNFKQIGLAVLQYNQDYDEYYPPSEVSTSGGGSFTTGYDWTYVVNPYVKNGSNNSVPVGGRPRASSFGYVPSGTCQRISPRSRSMALRTPHGRLLAGKPSSSRKSW